MKLEQKVCSLEISQRLIKAGIVVKSYFAWADEGYDHIPIELVPYFQVGVRSSIPAPLFPELAELLPETLHKTPFERLQISRFGEKWEVAYRANAGFLSDTEVNAAAAMLIWLKENGHLEDD